MKQIFIIFFLLLLFPIYASGNQENWISGGGEFGHFSETQYPSGTKVETTLNSIGGYVTALSFKNDNNVGMYVHDSFLIPLGGRIGVSGNFADYSLEEADMRFHLGMLLGPVFRKPFSEKIDYYFAIGPSIQELAITTSTSASLVFMFGIGGDLGVKYSLAESFYLDLGIVADYCFIAHTSNAYHQEWTIKNYSNISLRPHIGIGASYKMKYEHTK